MIKHLVITGLVQGVGYRAGFMREARILKLSGWVRNRLDGSVEAIIAGDEQSLQTIIEWAWRGPSGAQVRNVAAVDKEDTSMINGQFELRATQ